MEAPFRIELVEGFADGGEGAFTTDATTAVSFVVRSFAAVCWDISGLTSMTAQRSLLLSLSSSSVLL